MIETGVSLTLQDNASASARRVAAGFEEVAKSADDINSALDPRMLDEYNKKLTEIGEAYSKLDRGMKLRDQYQAQNVRQMTNMIQGVGGSLVQAGRGDVAGGMLTGVKSLAGMAGKIVGPAALAVAGLTAGGSKLADIYGERAGPAGIIARLEGAMGTDIEANTVALREAMKSTVDSVAKFGKTYEEGARARETFLRAGGTNFTGSGAAAYSLAMGADFGALASFTGMGQRYGQTGGLDVVNALMGAQGLGPGQFGEVMGGLQDTFTSFLSKGITRSMEDIGISQEYFGRLGPAWQGALGAQRLQGMDQAVAGAAGLQQQSDLFLYRAAAGITAKTGGGLIETRMLMERGLTPELFQGLMGQFGEMGFGREETIAQLAKTLKISTTAANALYGLSMGGEVSREGLREALKEGQGVTTETRYGETIEGIKQWVAEIGAGFYDLRADAIDGTIKIFKTLIDAGANASNAFNEFADTLRGTPGGLGAYSVNQRYTTFKAGVEKNKGIRGVSDFLAMLEVAEAAGVSQADIFAQITRPYNLARAGDARRSMLDPMELADLGKLLQELIIETKETTKAVNSDSILEAGSSADTKPSAIGSLLD